MKNEFESVSANESNPKWNEIIKREKELYRAKTDIRPAFERDYTRILHSNAYRRLKHKTQVFFSPGNDHICTRIEHVNYVESISYTIARHLGLNTDLTRAISIGHDVGHSPFGHKGEKILSEISKRDIGKTFWHEKNGLYMLDNIELLEDYEGNKQNLDLTYAVRDGVISHCGEINENAIIPRNEAIDLEQYEYPNQYEPYTWEGCVVKIADKISYIGRDIEDGIELGFIDKDLKDLYSQIGKKINNGSIINELVSNICKNSSVEEGLKFSDEYLDLMNKIKAYNYKNIYCAKRMEPSNKYFELVINQIYDILKDNYNNLDSVYFYYPKLITSFKEWINNYIEDGNRLTMKNKIVFDIRNKQDYYKAIITYISGMTDKFAIEMYNEIINF